MTARPRVLVTIAIVALALSGMAFASAFSAHAPASASKGSPSMVSSATTSHPTAPSLHASTSPGRQLVAPGPAAEAKLQAEIKANHINPHTIFPPNLLYAPKMSHGMIVSPSYPQAPEPAGLADYGVINTTGTPQSITINTQSYRANLTLNSLLPYYLATGTAEGFTSQLNVVLENVTLFGNSSYEFWAQDVMFYDANSNQISFENNVWNFTNTVFAMPQQTFYRGLPGYTNGSDNPLGSENYYAAGGGAYNGVAPPFTVVFYINVTTLDYLNTNYTELNFDYDILNGTGVQVAENMFDRVLFNNTGDANAIPQAMIHVDGTNITGTTFIPFDAEIMLGGPGGGSTATFDQLNATMTLQHWDSGLGTYVNEPSAWSSGSETGETSVGISDYYTSNDVAVLGAGPEFVQPFWNSSPTAAAGAAVLYGTISPSNSWAFATDAGAYNDSTSAWGALPPSGNYAWNLTQGTYTVKLMESDFDAVTSAPMTLTAGTATNYSVALTADMTAGVYTPLYAWSNSQLAAISSGGSGTQADPYMIVNNENTNLSAEFAAVNDYGYPAYPGLSLAYTTAYVEINNEAPFYVNFWGGSLTVALRTDTPTSNDLSTWLFETSHVSIVDSTFAGWFTGQATGFPYADVLVWNSTSDLLYGNTFEISSDGLFTYGGTGNSFISNSFLNSPLPGYDLLTPVVYLLPDFPFGVGIPTTGLIQNEGGDAIWNNYFATPFTAVESNQNTYDNLYASVPDNFANNWNLSAPAPASTVWTVNGIQITGAVGGYPYACGNWWADYVPGVTVLPYDELAYGFEWIATGGDYCPAGSLGAMLFVESGLPHGTAWSVTANGTAYSGSGSSLLAIVPAGIYDYTVGSVSGYAPTPSSGSTTVGWLGAVSTVSISFSSTAPTTGTLSGTVSPATATVWVDGTAVTVTSGSFSNSLSVGTHSVEATLAGYYPYYNNVTVSSGGTTSITITLNPVTQPIGPDGTLSVTVTTASATLWVDGSQVTLTSGAYSSSETPGVHSLVAMASGYYSYYNNITVSSSATSSVTITLNPVTPAPGPDGTLSITVTTPGATLWVNGNQEALSNGLYSATFTPNTPISIKVSAANYLTYYNNVTVSSGKTTPVTVTLTAIPSAPSSSSSSSNGISNTGWIIIGILAALAVIFLITTAIYMGRARGGKGGDEGNPPSGGSSN